MIRLRSKEKPGDGETLFAIVLRSRSATMGLPFPAAFDYFWSS